MAVTRHSDAVAPVRSSGPVGTWFRRHTSTAAGALGRLSGQPFSSLLIVLVIAITLAIPAALNLVVKNARALSSGWDNALDALTENPLPHTLIVRPAKSNTTQSIGLLQEELGNLPETELVQVDTEWVRRFHAILDIVREAIVIGASLLGAAIVVIIGNTIRLDIQNRREEIEVTKLIGASNAFVRRPFLWTGFWYGLFGGLLALGLVEYGLFLLEGPAARLAGLYRSAVTVLDLDLRESASIVGVGVALGLVGSWFAAARHMRRIEPR